MAPAAGEGGTTTTTVPARGRNGFFWWEFDPDVTVIRAMAAVGIA
jgi:fatty-acid desaturase